MSNFDRAFEFVVGEEGGYVNDPRDPGGETKFGISKRAYPNEDIANLTLERAKALYEKDYWQAIKGDSRPWGQALCLFDCAVNQGVAKAKTIDSEMQHGADYVVRFQAERALHYAKLGTFGRFGRGWMRRLLRTALEAARA